MTPTLPVQIERSGPLAGVAVLSLEQAGRPVVVLDLALIRAIEAAVHALPGDLRGLVLASNAERAFIAGADLTAIRDLDDEALHRYLAYGSKVFGMLSALPYPTAAAIHGAALGGGLEIAMHCDGLIGAPAAKAYPVGLPEAGLSICPGWGGTNLLPARLDPAEAIRRTASGKPLTFDEAREAGVFDDVAESASSLRETACRWVLARQTGARARDGAPLRWIGRADRAPAALSAMERVRDEIGGTDSGRAVAHAVDAGLAQGWQAALEVERRELVRLRSTPAGRQAINAFFEKSAKK
ncbi:MAG: enoyl-CoA hydratase-related protein [Planctomycetota bacterium]|nr:enoyl-CoA hydratase-related protein [Planctomycetota bacterium]